jgi:hypothetical protein
MSIPVTLYFLYQIKPEHPVISMTSEGIVLASTIVNQIQTEIESRESTPPENRDFQYVFDLSNYERMTSSATDGLVIRLHQLTKEPHRYHFIHTDPNTIILESISKSLDRYRRLSKLGRVWKTTKADINQWISVRPAPGVEMYDCWNGYSMQETDSTIDDICDSRNRNWKGRNNEIF